MATQIQGHCGLPVDTTGSQMGLDLVTKLFCCPGEVVIGEGPTYLGSMRVFGSDEVVLRQVPEDNDEMGTEEVAGLIDNSRVGPSSEGSACCLATPDGRSHRFWLGSNGHP